MDRRWRGVCSAATGLLLLILLAPSTTDAHPFDARFYSHRIVLHAGADSLKVGYSLEIPASEVMKQFAERYGEREEVGEAEDREFAATIFERAGSNLAVLVDGEARELTFAPVPDVPNGVSNGRFFVYHVQATTPMTWSDEPREVLVTNDNEIDRPAYYSGWVFTAGDLAVVSSSLSGIGADAAGEDAFEKAGAWSSDPVNRDLAVTFKVGPPEPETETPPAAEGGDGGGVATAAGSPVGPAWWWFAVPVALVLGALVGWRLRR